MHESRTAQPNRRRHPGNVRATQSGCEGGGCVLAHDLALVLQQSVNTESHT